ncbi:MAG: zf-TFIIB domain-containing protein [Bacteroidota bacterium]|nr:zf-TFIIB domain-containing protein [Bacteroidota bacterium]
MKCPLCNIDLTMSNRQDIEIDYCPNCRGVWLDRGELDKIIERSIPDQPAKNQTLSSNYRREEHGGDSDYKYNKKRKGFLGDLFDF